MDRRARPLAWIGLASALVGVCLLIDPPEDDLLPVNYVLLMLVSALILISVLVSLKRRGR